MRKLVQTDVSSTYGKLVQTDVSSTLHNIPMCSEGERWSSGVDARMLYILLCYDGRKRLPPVAIERMSGRIVVKEIHEHSRCLLKWFL